jgi:hypothetical protein
MRIELVYLGWGQTAPYGRGSEENRGIGMDSPYRNRFTALEWIRGIGKESRHWNRSIGPGGSHFQIRKKNWFH